MVDRLNHPLPSDKALSAAFNELKDTLALTDVWRLTNNNSREYTFYFKVHNLYSRIDYLPKSKVLDSQIHSIIISDHAPLSVTFSPLVNIHKIKHWRFNNSFERSRIYY